MLRGYALINVEPGRTEIALRNVRCSDLNRKERTMLYTTRSKFISSLLVVALLVGLVSIYTGRQLLYKTVLSEAENRISLDLNAARRERDKPPD